MSWIPRWIRQRWGFNDRRASQLIRAAEVSKILGTSPPNDAVARELAPLPDQPDENPATAAADREFRRFQRTMARLREHDDA